MGPPNEPKKLRPLRGEKEGWMGEVLFVCVGGEGGGGGGASTLPCPHTPPPYPSSLPHPNASNKRGKKEILFHQEGVFFFQMFVFFCTFKKLRKRWKGGFFWVEGWREYLLPPPQT